MYCSLLFVYFYLCDCVDDLPFEGDQEQVYKEENQQFGEEGKWPPPLHILFCPNNIMLIHFNLLLFLHKLDGNPIKDIT